MTHRKLNEAEARLYWQVYVGWSTQGPATGGIANAPIHAARAVLRARLATEQTAPVAFGFEPTIDDIREMARDVFVHAAAEQRCPEPHCALAYGHEGACSL